MLQAGDELGRTQHGNNNAYCQDNEISWVNWADADTDLLEFTRVLIGLRRDHPVFRRRRFFRDRRWHGEMADIAWFAPSGQHMNDEDWDADRGMAVAVFLNGDAITEPDPRGQRIVDDSFLLLFNPSPDEVPFAVPAPPYDGPWEIILGTAAAQQRSDVRRIQPVHVGPHSLCVLRQTRYQIRGSSM